MSATDNYFRAGRRVFFFNSKDVASIALAWAKASDRDQAAIFRPVEAWGYWHGCAIIGVSPAGRRPSEGEDATVWNAACEQHKKMWATLTSHYT